MCTAIVQWMPNEPLRILAVRDEFISRDFDDPSDWWPDHPGVVGGRDGQAGGSWCVSDVVSGMTALVINRRERTTGTPSRGLLPLAAIDVGDSWPDDLDYSAMASFLLVIAGPMGVTSWGWNGETLCRDALTAGVHIFTSLGVDGHDAKTERLQAQIPQQSWFDVVTASRPAASDDALIVRRELEIGTYATVFTQLIDSTPGKLQIRYSRTPWERSTWATGSWR